MFPNTCFDFLAVAFLVFGQVQSAEAAQWPVNGAPVNQAVPQYRASYPLFDAPQKQKTKTQRPNSMLESIADSVSDESPDSLQSETGRKNAAPLPEPKVSDPEKPNAVQSQPESVTKPQSKLNRQPNEWAAPAQIPAVNQTPSRAANEHTAKKPTTKKKKRNPPAISYDIYRDRNPFPIDPRKPCGICTNPADRTGCGCGPLFDAPGLHGKPFQESEPGACECGKKKCGKCSPMFSVYWPRPFSAKLDEHFPGKADQRYSPCQKKRIVDVFDKFADFKLIDYQRKDNGYCGEDSDPYGCLGENRMIASGVAGVGYRFPSVPVDRSASRKSSWY
jgi:hypothetical protein